MKNTSKKQLGISKTLHFKRSRVVGLLLLLVLSINLSANVNQNLQDRFSLTINNKTLSETLKEITDKSHYIFFFYTGYVDNNQKISLKTDNLTIKETLDKLFAGSDKTYSIDGKQVYIQKKKAAQAAVSPANTPKRIQIKGVVLDSNKEPIIGANLAIKELGLGTITDLDGNFTLNQVPLNSKVIVTYIGFKESSFKVEENKNYTILLKEDDQLLEEIVVVGYGTERRSLVTGAISKLSVDESKLKQAVSPAELLDGRIAGVSVSSTSGNLGSGESISIRGASSISAGNEPLYVIDGIPITNTNANLYNFGESMSSLATLNLTDIESIEILKDAASAAIYGSRATNGVVVITTKSGKEGRSDIKLNVNTGITRFPNKNKVKTANSELYIRDYNEGVDNYNKQYGYQLGDSKYEAHIQNPFGNLPDTDWMDVITQTGEFLNLDGSFSGGSKKTRFYVGANYTDQTGVIKTNSLKKLNLKAKISHEMTSWLEVGANTSGNYLKNYQVPGAGSGTTIINRAFLQRPFDRPYKPNGDYYVGGTDELVFHNPLQVLNEQKAYFENMRFLGNYYALFKLKDKLTWRFNFNADITQSYDYTYYNENHPYGGGQGRILDRNQTIKNILAENVVSYRDQFLNKSISLSAIAGHSFQKVSQRHANIDARGFPSPSFDMATVASEIFAASANLSNYAMESYFGRATVAYKDRYVLTGTLRTDGSSKFAKDKRWGWFPSVSFGWNLNQEEWMKDSSTDIKMRVSYGKTGNQEGIGRYSYQSLLSGGKNYDNQSGIAVSSFGNKELTWERADQYDFGFDITFLNGKINTMLDIYQKNTTDLLYNRPVHATTGVTSIISNIGSMRNRGIEFTLNTHLKFGKVEWLSQFNISRNKNKITKLLGDDDRPISIGGNRALQVGKEMGAFYIFEQQGIYQYDGEVPEPQYAMGVRAGDVKWTDVDNNGIINDNDRVVKGSSNPDFFGGFNNTFKYRNFQLDIFLTYMYGNDTYAEWKLNPTKLGHRTGVLKKYAENRWTGPGSTNHYPRSVYADTNNSKNSDRFLEDGSFIRLKTMTLSYTFPQHLLSKVYLKGLRLYLQGDNLLLLSRYSGWDPEISNNLSPQFAGVDTFGVPQPRTFSFGFNLTL